MNERIRELWTQAGGHYNSGDQHTWPEYTIDDPEKFAELIVKECSAICQDIDGEDNIDAKSGRQDCAVEIQEYFGVEE